MTLYIWQHWAKENYFQQDCRYKGYHNPNRAKYIKRWVEKESQPITVYFLRIPLLISKEQKENIICSMDDVRGDVLGPPHGTTATEVIANKSKSEIIVEQ